VRGRERDCLPRAIRVHAAFGLRFPSPFNFIRSVCSVFVETFKESLRKAGAISSRELKGFFALRDQEACSSVSPFVLVANRTSLGQPPERVRLTLHLFCCVLVMAQYSSNYDYCRGGAHQHDLHASSNNSLCRG
jgi:hypothetical protein